MNRRDIDGGKVFDWGRVSEDYAKYRDIYPDEFYRRIVELGLCIRGQRVLDLGTGTGVLPRNLYQHGAEFTGVDISENQIAQAKKLAQQQGMDIDFLVSAAESLPFGDGVFDVVTACQCFGYFNKEIVLPKIHGLLKPGGRFCILWMAWLPFEDPIAQQTERLVLKYNPAWSAAGLRRGHTEIPDWASKLFKVKNLVGFDVNVRFTRESWQGRIKACRGVGASSLPDETIEAFAREHWAMLQQMPESFDVLHYVSMVDFIKKTV